MSKALKNVVEKKVVAKPKAKATAQTVKARPDQVKNNAGGYVFKVTDQVRLERFLILGVDGGTYYVQEQKLTNENVAFLAAYVAKDPRTFVETVINVSTTGRAPKNSPAIFALAVALTHAPVEYKAHVRVAVGQVCRTATHLFEFAQYIENLSGWGRAKRGAVADWYESKTTDQLAYQAIKYRQRDGWTHRDLLRLSHPKDLDQAVLDFVLGKDGDTSPNNLITGFKALQRAQSATAVTTLLKAYPTLPWEAIPTQFLTDAAVWRTLYDNGAIGETALLRNVTRFEKIGLFKDLKFAKDVANTLSDVDKIRKGRLHPVGFLNALGIYRNGDYTAAVVAGLEDGFYNSFQTLEPSNARTMLAIDVSASMTWGSPAGLVGMDYRGAAAAMAAVALRTEPYTLVGAFSGDIKQVNVSSNDKYDELVRKINNQPAGGTNCALPMLWALKNKIEIDHFSVYTDNETWVSKPHPFQALQQYREKTGINAKLTVVGLAATPFTIADPTDAGMLDVVGFDSAAPRVIADFARV